MHARAWFTDEPRLVVSEPNVLAAVFNAASLHKSEKFEREGDKHRKKRWNKRREDKAPEEKGNTKSRRKEQKQGENKKQTGEHGKKIGTCLGKG